MNIFKGIILLIIILTVGCKKEASDLDNEKDVMDQIFIDLVERLYDDMRTGPLVFPPPPPGGYKSEEDRERTMLMMEKIKKEHILNKERILKDTSRILIIVYDTIDKYTERLKPLNDEYYENIIFLNHPASIDST